MPTIEADAPTLGAGAAPLAEPDVDEQLRSELERLWAVVLHNDDWNIDVFVAAALMEVLSCDRDRAWRHVNEAQTDGRSVVDAFSDRDEADKVAVALQAKQLTVTVESTGGGQETL